MKPLSNILVLLTNHWELFTISPETWGSLREETIPASLSPQGLAHTTHLKACGPREESL